MNAAADYKAAVAYLSRPLPAYVSYHERSHVKMDAIVHDDSGTIVVRTKDGKIVKGKALPVKIDRDTTYSESVVTRPPFDPACYTASSARSDTFDGRPVEAIGLHRTCPTESNGHSGFKTLYVDRASHLPLAAVGGETTTPLVVSLEQRYVRAGNYVLPAALDVRIKGSGIMFWLDVIVHQEYSGYSFSQKMPG